MLRSLVGSEMCIRDSNNTAIESVFQWLQKKHYLLLLKNEYSKALSCDTYNRHSRIMSYLQEIKQVTQEIKDLGHSFIDGQ